MRLGALVLAVVAVLGVAAWAVWPRQAPSAASASKVQAVAPALALESASDADDSAGTATTTAVVDGAASDDYLAYSPTPETPQATPVEIPEVTGRDLVDARALLAAAGLNPTWEPTANDRAASVVSQKPAAGLIAEAGSKVVLALSTAGTTPPTVPKTRTLVVCIDPGHQSHSNSEKEPIGPGSKTLKAKVTGGATGVKTRVPEYEVVLQIANNVRTRLRRAGVKVVMTRTTNDVNLSNAQRAQIANRARADLFLRIHANGSPDPKAAGISTLYPAVTRWTGSTSAPSRRAATLTQRGVLASTRAGNDGVRARSDVAGFNWCTRPSILVECGFLSNPIEDRLLTSPGYQDKVAAGITAGVLRYLGK